MFCKKIIKTGTIFFVFCMPFNMDCFFKDKKIEPSVSEKPLFFQQGEYRDGNYLQFTVDKSAFIWGSMAGISMRTLVSLAQCGTKIESFKSSVLRPGVVKSMLFWVPMIVGYRYVLALKTNQKLQNRLAMYGENMAKHFSLDDQKPGNE